MTKTSAMSYKNIYEEAYNINAWEEFYKDYSENEHAYKAKVLDLREYIDSGAYLNILKEYEASGSFPLPRLIRINKKGSEKKRTVFAFDRDASWLLKFFGFMLHCYDDIFCDNLYSFRKERSVKTAVARLVKQKNIPQMYGMKLDIHDYFNSSKTELLLQKLQVVLSSQEKLLMLFKTILSDTNVLTSSGRIVCPINKGMMAGNPLSPFLANLYLNDLDRHFEKEDIFYARYSDDILFFTESEEKRDGEYRYIIEFLEKSGLTLNPDKVSRIAPGENFEFLGFSFTKYGIDVSKTSFEKIKKKIRRKARAVLRWKKKKDVDAEKAVKVFIRYFNRKFFENPVKSELTWCRWYFPIITSDRSLKEIDHYLQENIRFVYCGRHSKRGYNLRYARMKELGYRSLVNEFHKE